MTGVILLSELPSVETVRQLGTQPDLVVALRVTLMILGASGSAAWAWRRPRLSWALTVFAGLMGLSYWLVQIQSPLGLGVNGPLTRDWAQAGVIRSGHGASEGFVWGTEATGSLIALVARTGAPLDLLFFVPQGAAFLLLVLLAIAPFLIYASRITAAFASILAVTGGLWPGLCFYPLALIHPSIALFALTALATLAVFARLKERVGVGRRLGLGMPGVLVGSGALVLGASQSQAGQATACVLLSCATIGLAGLLRAGLRKAWPDPARARRAEALLLLACALGGGLSWWEPERTLPEFREARNSGLSLRKPLEWMALNVPVGEVVLSSSRYSAFIATFAGRRVLFPPLEQDGAAEPLREPRRRERLHRLALEGRPPENLAHHFSVTHLLLGPGEPDPGPPGSSPAAATPGEPRLTLRLVYRDEEDFRVYRFAKQ